MLPDWFLQLGVMRWPLAGCAIVALTLCLERSIFAIQVKMQKKRQYEFLADYVIQHQSKPKSIRDEMVALKLEALQSNYYKGLKLLRIIGTMAPMLGLLGTILGIIDAFKTIASQAGPVSPNLIADGLWEAMLTTAVGLSIALPILLLAFFFRHLSEQQLKQFCMQLNQLSISLTLQETD
ncbi:unnamed protein product, partial [Chrysoparadoxa australica]